MEEKENINTPNNQSKSVTRNNRSLLWAIILLLVALISLVAVYVAFNMIDKQDSQLTPEPSVTQKSNKAQKPPVTPEKTPEPEVKPSEPVVQAPPLAAEEKPVEDEEEEPEPEDCKAKDFDGKKYDDGESYTTLDGCETCTCNDGNWGCKVKPSCIILPSDCTYDNQIYHNGETRSAECDQTCTCDGGNWDCVMSPSSLCCERDGQIHPNGASFPAGDDCNTCTCNSGSVNCTLMFCIAPPSP